VGGGHNAGSGYREACLQAVDCLADVDESTVCLELAFVVAEVAGERPFLRLGIGEEFRTGMDAVFSGPVPAAQVDARLSALRVVEKGFLGAPVDADRRSRFLPLGLVHGAPHSRGDGRRG